jgi:hypothetical protein
MALSTPHTAIAKVEHAVGDLLAETRLPRSNNGANG